MKVRILQTDGTVISPAAFSLLGRYTLDEIPFDPKKLSELVLCEPLMEVVNEYCRITDTKPEILVMNMTMDWQRATHYEDHMSAPEHFRGHLSTHVTWMAVDLAGADREKLREAAKNVNVKIRTGQYKDYVHLDVAPMYYAEGRPWFHDVHHIAPITKTWKQEIDW